MTPPDQKIVAGDIGGTNARFCLAELSEGRVARLGEPVTLHTRDFPSLAAAWAAFGRAVGPLPRAASLALACPIKGEELKLTNNPWVMRPATLARELGLDRLLLLNDFGAIGHAVAHCGPEDLPHLAGPDVPLPAIGIVSIVGPGTGLGVAQLLSRAAQRIVIETEGGHTDFAPLDELEDKILAILRRRYNRVSVERIVSGPGLKNLYEALAEIQDQPVRMREDPEIWADAISGADPLAASALQRFGLSLGAVAGDLALSHGAAGVVLAGSLVGRIAHLLPASGFAGRFVAKGRFERLMSDLPIRRIAHPQPGLLGAAAAFLASGG